MSHFAIVVIKEGEDMTTTYEIKISSNYFGDYFARLCQQIDGRIFHVDFDLEKGTHTTPLEIIKEGEKLTKLRVSQEVIDDIYSDAVYQNENAKDYGNTPYARQTRNVALALKKQVAISEETLLKYPIR